MVQSRSSPVESASDSGGSRRRAPARLASRKQQDRVAVWRVKTTCGFSLRLLCCCNVAAYLLGADRFPSASCALGRCSIVCNAASKAASAYGEAIANGRHARRCRRIQREEGSVGAEAPHDNSRSNASKMSGGSACIHKQTPAQHT